MLKEKQFLFKMLTQLACCVSLAVSGPAGKDFST